MALSLHMNPEYMQEIQKQVAYGHAAVPNVGNIAAARAANQQADGINNMRAGMAQQSRKGNLAMNRERFNMESRRAGHGARLYDRMMKNAKKDGKRALWLNAGNMVANIGMKAAMMNAGAPAAGAGGNEAALVQRGLDDEKEMARRYGGNIYGSL